MNECLLEFVSDRMKNKRYSILVLGYLFGQYRIRLTDTAKPDASAPPGHGFIVREFCTYKFDKMSLVVTQLRDTDDPEAVAESFAKPWNCEGPGGRIRLDTEQKDNPHRAERVNQ